MTMSKYMQQLEGPAVAGLYFLLQETCSRLMDEFLPVRQELSSLAGNLSYELSFLWVRD